VYKSEQISIKPILTFLLSNWKNIIEEIINKLDISKSPGMDLLLPSHFKNCHPIVLLTLTKLFKLILTFNYVAK